MRRIEKPPWAGAPEFRISGSLSAEERVALDMQENDLMLEVDEIVQRYIDNPKLTFDSEENLFPSRGRMTGEYYVSSQACRVSDEPWYRNVGRSREVAFSIMVHCLEHALCPGQIDRNYLGLEIDFSFVQASRKFVHFGDVNSSCI